MLGFVLAAEAADVHIRIATDDGAVNEEVGWPSSETHSQKLGPFQGKKLVQQWTVTAMPSVFDPIGGTYQLEVSLCVKWAKSGHNDEYCEKLDVPASSAPAVVAQKFIKAKHGVKIAWEVSAWYTGQTPAVGLPAEQE